ncbi:SHOCT domain-containing protein [Petroclostridium xylanilyticum]|jgi:DNA-binding PadR family transcriptional regulator|uniref:SHOCT domain-containing protein n=1 Tax=Petroclostridium xylanilyticum TaxID=1792311 RepID=UPI000B99642E|nr:SHOCT domain-containing protein [Petroclostridium xylanilyticum]
MIEAANHISYSPQDINHTKITQEELQREVDYWRAYKILQRMLKAGLISEEEFNKIDKLNRKTFSPMYAQLMA